jgi:hypothetical protein
LAVEEVPEPVGFGVTDAETVELVEVLFDPPVGALPVEVAEEAHDATVGT